MAASKGGGCTIELTEQSKKNIDLQMSKLKGLAPKVAFDGMIKILFDIKGLAKLKLKSDKHIKTSRLWNSIYVQTLRGENRDDNRANYTDDEGKSYKSELNVSLTDKEGAVGTNVEYAGAIEYGYGAHVITVKNPKGLMKKEKGKWTFFGKSVKHPGFKGDSFLYWAMKNVDLNKRITEISDKLLKGIR